MKSVGVLLMLFFMSSCYQLFGQVYDKSGEGQMSGGDITVQLYKNQDQKKVINREFAIIGMNLMNSDRSEMGPFYVTDRQDGYAYNYEGLPEAGIDNKQYAEDMKSGNYPIGEEVKTCERETKREKKKKNKLL